MSITSGRAAYVLSMAVTYNGCGKTTSDEMREAVSAGVDALREKAVREAQPLTMVDLRSMDGKTVYCLELNMEVRVATRRTGWITVHWPLPMEKECCKAHGLTLYRRNPYDSCE